jgi:hypothetical protein
LIEFITPMLDDEDDPALWQVVVDHILAELPKDTNTRVEIGRCSHWLRPHKSRWTADGGFASPVGYGGSGFSFRGRPLFDWSIVAKWTGDRWAATGAKDRKGKAVKTSLRVTVPSRTTRHPQAAVHTLWFQGMRTEWRLYGFRKREGTWRCTAETDWELDRCSHD